MKFGSECQQNSIRKMTNDKWMTDFYGRDWYKVSPGERCNEPGLYECIVDAKDFDQINTLMRDGFSLVETAVEFVTLINKFEEPKYDIREAEEKDYDQIKELITLNYRKNAHFYNRFKSSDFFTSEQTESYFQFTFDNYAKTSIIVVYEDNQGIAGFYMLRKVSDDRLVYKGILCGSLKRVRGMNMHIEMQKACAKIIGTPYNVINRTQMTNYKIVNNHIQSQRHLLKVEHYFYKLITS